MTCDDVRPRLTAYLDGDLDPDRGTVVRGHLRTCDACRKVAEQEAVLRDGLRTLPTVDAPSGMWANIQAQLAAAEVAESQRPGWKRAISRWMPMLPRFAMGGVLAAAAVGILWWRTHESPEPTATKLVDVPSQKIEAAAPIAVAPTVTPSCNLDGPADADVTADLAGEAARVTACYAQTANELLALMTEARGAWTDEQRAAFDTQLATLKSAVDNAPADDARARQRAYRAMNRYLQNAITRDTIALASVGAP
jgi:anti-sigma factor (TIGR02949 family)